MALKKTAPQHTADRSNRFPPEAFEPMDDVTEEGIEKVRTKAAPYIEAEEWEHIDGFDGEDSKMD
jgi:hypothetical protein